MKLSHIPTEAAVHKVDNVTVVAAIEVVGTSLVITGDVTGVGPPILGTATGTMGLDGTVPLVGVTTMESNGTDVGKVVVSFDGTVGTTITGTGTVGTAGGTIVGTLGWSTDDGATAGEANVSHWKVAHVFVSAVIQFNHGSTTSRHRRQDKQSMLTASQTIPS